MLDGGISVQRRRKRCGWLRSAAIVIIALARTALAAPDGAEAIASVASTAVWKDAGPPAAIVFRAGMAIEVDGAPTAYHAQDALALNRLSGAGRPGHWWAIVTRQGQPVVQTARDPAPGYYVSMTSLQNSAFPETDPRRYVDASTVPYIALPKAVTEAGGIALGDLVAVANQGNGKVAFAIYADRGPKNKLGEGSLYLANQLRDKPLRDRDAVKRSLPAKIVYVVFPGSGNGRPKRCDEIARIGKQLFGQWGGMASIDRWFPE